MSEQVKAALFSLARTQKRLAHQYKRWALEAEQTGKLNKYNKYRAESDRLWNSAKWNLQRARIW